MEELVKNVTVYEFLKQEPLPGGYHENKKFIYIVREQFLDLVDDEVRSSMGLVEERQYADLFGKYVTTSRTGPRRRSCATRSPGASTIPTRT